MKTFIHKHSKEVNRQGAPECPIKDNVVLRSRGLADAQLELLSTYARHGFPDLFELSDIMHIRENALVKRFSRIEKTLGLKNRAGLVQLLTVVSRFDTGCTEQPPRIRRENVSYPYI